jgi:hypothetical protein
MCIRMCTPNTPSVPHIWIGCSGSSVHDFCCCCCCHYCCCCCCCRLAWCAAMSQAIMRTEALASALRTCSPLRRHPQSSGATRSAVHRQKCGLQHTAQLDSVPLPMLPLKLVPVAASPQLSFQDPASLQSRTPLHHISACLHQCKLCCL